MTLEEFDAALANGPYVWPGGYPLYFIMAYGEALSFKAAAEARQRIARELADPLDPEWRPVACDINWEDGALYCAHTNTRIESVYAEESDQ